MSRRPLLSVFIGLAALFVPAQHGQAQGVELAVCILQQPPFAPLDVSLLTPQVYTAASIMGPATWPQ
jgi:hypothetical protein